MELPKKYDSKSIEEKWIDNWQKKGTYKFNPETKKPFFTVDTPPPTISGRMHIGHAFSFTQQDFIQRYKRMKGFEVFVPFGTDDNGLATERLVEKENKVRESDFSREEFINLCLKTLEKIRPQYISDWKKIGFSADYSINYTTISKESQKISQKSFINIYKKGREYRKDAPSIWCPKCHCAIAQVELEDTETDSFFNDIVFKVDGKELIVATTRPELLPACVAVFAHPDDERYKDLIGKKAVVPVFNHEVPIIADERADPEKGTGIVMCCTFGDQTDMEWYFVHNLPLRQALTRDGKMTELAGKYEGMKIIDARKEIIKDMKEQGLLKDQRPIKHIVNVHERCGTPIEILQTKQWFLKYLDIKEKLLDAGKKLRWHPEHMRNRYDNWIKGLQWDWSLSRQRFYGVPIPAWYCDDCDEVILPSEDMLPVDPTKDKPPVDKCPKCSSKKIIGEKDVLDTWATSSLSPQLAVEQFPQIKDKLYPMDLRPQAHDIITFWLFNTVVKSQLHNDVNPWKNAMISGWALDPKGKKMSKSKGNAIAPQTMIEKYSGDALRYWASTAKLGEDVPTQDKDFQNGQKLVTKLFNASKFSLMHLEDFNANEFDTKNLEASDKWLLSKIQDIIKEATEAFDNYEYSKARQVTDNFFWNTFCDNYLEIVKDRLYNPEERGEDAKRSAQYTLHTAITTILKLYAPFVSFVTEEIWNWHFSKENNFVSIHNSSWPEFNKELVSEEIEKKGDEIIKVIEAARKFKAEKQMSMKEELKKIIISTELNLQGFIDDLKATTKAKEVEFNSGEFDVSIDNE
ncbi:MAG: valine--tRNA ligase [Candidatus Woesearchaeota archaeon]